MNVGALLGEHIQELGDGSNVFHYEGREISSKETYERTCRLANALAGLGVKPGEVVAITMANSPDVFESFGAIFGIGAVALPVLFLLTPEETRFILSDAGAVAVITDTFQQEKVLQAVEGLDSVRHVIVVGAEDGGAVRGYEGLLQRASSDFTPVERDGDDLAMIMYTSGTTAQPKGVMLTHRNLLESSRSAYISNETSHATRSLFCLPMAHIYGVQTMLIANLTRFPGSLGVMMRWFDPEQSMRLIQEHRVDLFPGVPTIFNLILYHPELDKYDLSSLKDCVSGAAPLPAELLHNFQDRFGIRIRSIYGLTESSGIGSMVRPSDPVREGTVGRAYENSELAILDEDGNVLEAGDVGEICIKGPMVMKGYLNRPEDTEQALRGGWLHTGDVGYLDDEGFLYITDRVKDLIIKGGENIMPAQVEEVIYRHPAVSECAVIGVTDPSYGEDIVACVVLKPGMEATPQEILEFACKHLSRFKQPREVVILESMPRSSIGKILKRELRRTLR